MRRSILKNVLLTCRCCCCCCRLLLLKACATVTAVPSSCASAAVRVSGGRPAHPWTNNVGAGLTVEGGMSQMGFAQVWLKPVLFPGEVLARRYRVGRRHIEVGVARSQLLAPECRRQLRSALACPPRREK